MKSLIRWCFAAILFTNFFVTDLFAEIYCYIDGNGVRHFSNVPTSPVYRPYTSESLNFRAGSFWSDYYDHYIRQASRAHGISFELIKAMIKVESNFNYRAVSRRGAMGLMQIMPSNINLLNISDPFDPWENIMGGSKYLKRLLERFDGKVSLALAAYNAWPEKVEQYKSIPPYAETENYVESVLKYYGILKKR